MANTVADLIASLTLDASAFFRDTGKVDASLKAWDTDIKKATEGFTALGSRLTDVGTRLSVLSAGIVAGGLVVGDLAKDFDLAMRQVSSLLGDSGKSFDELSAKTLKLSTAMGVDATKSAQALYEVLSADIPQENAIAFLETSSKAAIAGVTDTKTAVDGLTTVIKSFGLEVSDADKVADAMFQTVNIGKVTFPELAASIGQASGMAHTLGVSYQELMAAGATITKQGQSFSEGMTQVTSALRAMIDPSKEMQDLFDKLGVSSGKALIAANGFEGALQKIREAAQGNETVLSTAFGHIEGLRGILALTGEQAKGAAADLARVTDSAGAMGGAFDEIEKSWSRQLEKFWVELKNIGIEIGKNLLPALMDALKAAKPLVDVFASAAKVFADLSPSIQTAVIGLVALVAALGPMLLITGQLIASITSITGLLGMGAGLAGILSLATPLAIAFGAAIAAWAIYEAITKIQALNKEMDRLNVLQQAGVKATQQQAKEIEILEKILDRNGKAYDFTGKTLEQYIKSLRDSVSQLDEFKGKQIQAGTAVKDGTINIAAAAKEYLGIGVEAKKAEKPISDTGKALSGTGKAISDTGGKADQTKASLQAMAAHMERVRDSFKEAEEPAHDLGEAWRDVTDAVQHYIATGDLDAMNRVWAEQPPILAEIENSLAPLPELAQDFADAITGLNVSHMSGGFDIPRQVQESWDGALEAMQDGFKENEEKATAWSRQVSTIISDTGEQMADLIIGLFSDDPGNVKLEEQLAELQSSLEDRTVAYEEYASDIADQIEELTSKHGEAAAKELEDLEESLQKQADAYEDYVKDAKKRLEDLDRREGRSGEDDEKRIQRTSDDYADGLNDQKRALERNIRDKSQIYERDRNELERKIAAELAKGDKANQESIASWRRSLEEKRLDYEEYVADQKANLDEWINEHATALQRQLEDINTAAERRRQDLEAEKAELAEGTAARAAALEQARIDAVTGADAIRNAHATALAAEIVDLEGKLAEKLAVLDNWRTQSYEPKLKEIEDAFKGVWERVGGAFQGMLTSAATALTRFGTETLVGGLFKQLTGEGGLLSHLGKVGEALDKVFSGGGGSAVSAGGGAARGGAGGAAGGVGSAIGGIGGMVNMISGIAGAAAGIIGLFHSPLAGDTGKTEINTRETKMELINLRADLWAQQENWFHKADDWRTVSQEVLGLTYARLGEIGLIAGDINSGTDRIVGAIRELKTSTLQVSVTNFSDFSAELRTQAVTGV